MKRGFWLWMLLAAGLIIGTFYLASGNIGIYIDLTSFFISVVTAFILSLTSSSPKDIASYIRQSKESTPLDSVLAKQGMAYFEMLQWLMIALGILGTFIGTVAVLHSLSNNAKIGLSFSVAILTILYSVVFSVIFTQPFIGALKKKLASQK